LKEGSDRMTIEKLTDEQRQKLLDSEAMRALASSTRVSIPCSNQIIEALAAAPEHTGPLPQGLMVADGGLSGVGMKVDDIIPKGWRRTAAGGLCYDPVAAPEHTVSAANPAPSLLAEVMRLESDLAAAHAWLAELEATLRTTNEYHQVQLNAANALADAAERRLETADAAWRKELSGECVSTFKEAWAEKRRQGYRYGKEALEQVEMGWNLRRSRAESEVAALRALLREAMLCVPSELSARIFDALSGEGGRS
jgi:hypothetical protein